MKTKYNKCFMEAFNLTEQNVENLEYQGIEAWDSVGHMGLIAEIESAFSVEFSADDIIDFSSYKKGIEILKKYGVEL